MANKIWMLSFDNCIRQKGTGFVCKESVSFIPGGCGLIIVYNGISTGISIHSGFASIVSSADRNLCPPDYPFYSDESAGCVTSINPDQPCDCINGGCLPKTTYGTPGVFANLAACEAGCAKNSNCTGECVDPAEIAAHQQALNNLKAKIC
jgi:hypothetical protein